MNLKQYRQFKGLTQSELATELKDVADGMDVPMISKIEKGICEPPIEVVAYINRGNGKKLNQRERVIDYILNFGSITSWDAYRDLGITQLATRIFELKEEGYEFDTAVELGKNRFGKNISWVRYTLKEKP